MTELLILVKFTNVLLIVKTNGELKTALKVIQWSIVNAHSGLPNVQVNGIVMISSISQLMLSTIMILTMMVPSILKIPLKKPT